MRNIEQYSHAASGVLIAAASDGSWAPMKIETHEIVFNITEANKHKKIKAVCLVYNKFFTRHESSSTEVTAIGIASIKAYGLAADLDTGIRIKGANGDVAKYG